MTQEKEEQFSKALLHLERIFNNLNQHWHTIQLLLNYVSHPLQIDDRGLSTHLRKFTEDIGNFIEEMRKFDFVQSSAEIKFIGKRLDNIEKILSEMNEKGIKKKIHLDFTVDGYEMVKKTVSYDPTEEIQDENIDIVLNTLLQKEKLAVIHRVGLKNQKVKTYDEIGKILKVHRERASQIFHKALRKLRHPTRIEYIKNCSHKELRKEVIGD